MQFIALTKRLLLTISALLLLLGSGSAFAHKGETPIQKDLSELDECLGRYGELCTEREKNIADLLELIPSSDLESSYAIYEKVYELCAAYNFDRACEVLSAQEELSRRLRNKEKLNEVLLHRAEINIAAGLFLEGSQILFSQIDTLSLSKSQKDSYYQQCLRFSCDYAEYSRTPEQRQELYREAGRYMKLILESSDPQSYTYRYYKMVDYANNDFLEQARDAALEIVETLDPQSRPSAIVSYYLAMVYDRLGDTPNAIHWYSESAKNDIHNCAKDNASLCCLAIILFDRGDVERAFRYINTSMDDAVFFNSKVRPWQISKSLPAIERAYNGGQKRMNALYRKLVISLSSVSCALLLILAYLAYLFADRKKRNRELSRLNAELQHTLGELSEANAAKEEYLGLFLSMSSDYLWKLKKLYSREQMESELKTFYATFDNAFISLYPDFVEKFNSLLKPSEQIELKKDELLNTELRIFALIKLGITQSSHIAALLRYSVNTIYNYRAQIKNAALNDRDNFEERVREL